MHLQYIDDPPMYVADLHSWSLEVPDDKVFEALARAGYQVVAYPRELLIRHVIGRARACIGVSRYKLRAQASLAPEIVDCSSFTRWCYQFVGLWLPRLALQQFEQAEKTEEYLAGDLIFTGGTRHDYYRADPNEGIGHVAIVTDTQTVIHANRRSGTVSEELAGDYLARASSRLRGFGRYLPTASDLLTVYPLQNAEPFRTSDDLYFEVVRMLSRFS